MAFEHVSVLLHETVDGLNVKPDGIYVDATLGGGGHAYEVCTKLGEQGRVLVPPSLRKNAHLEKEVVLVGVQDRVEIWDKALWEEKNQISEEDLDAIAERMESIGIRI